MMNFFVYFSPLSNQHNSIALHPESSSRLETFEAEVMGTSLQNVTWLQSQRVASNDELQLVHTQNLIDQVAATQLRDFSQLDADTYANKHSNHIARIAVGTLLDCVDSALLQKKQRLYAIVRPPGHHATQSQAMGFCLFNNIALGAAYALQKYNLQRIAIFDFDVHHGNGTQDIFYDTEKVLYLSCHQYPFFPGSGNWNEVGKKKGEGFTINCPLRMGSGDTEYLFLWDKVFEKIILQYKPQLLFVSAGYDAHTFDPLAQLELTDSGFLYLARRIHAMAKKINVPLLYSLEGGYNKRTLSQNIKDCLQSHLDVDSNVVERPPNRYCHDLLTQSQKAFGQYWKI